MTENDVLKIDSFKEMIKALPCGAGIYYVYPDGSIELEYLNDNFYDLINSTRDERQKYLGFGVLDSAKETDRPRIVDALREMIRNHSTANINIQVRDKEERYHWLNVRASVAYQLADRAVVYMVFSLEEKLNIELQKEAQIRYEREIKLRQELIKDAVVYYRINLSSQKVEEFHSSIHNTEHLHLPMKMSELIEKGIFNGIYGPDQEHFLLMLNPIHMLQNYYSGKTTETFLYRRYVPEKGLRWLKGSIAKLKRVSSDDVIAFFTAIDVDEEQKEQQLIRDVMDEEVESLITMKVASRQIRVIMENRKLEGYDPQQTETLYMQMSEAFRSSLFHDMLEEDKDSASAFITTDNIVEGLKTHPVLQQTYRIRTPEGQIRRKKVRVFYLDETKEDIIFVRRDITDLYNEEQRQKEILQKAIDAADAANRSKSDFLSRMSHDMRTPLNAIIGYSGDVLRKDATEEQKDEFLDDIHASGKYLLGIINDVLDMTKIESSKMVLHPEPYSGREFRQNIETVILPLCQNKKLTLEMKFVEDLNQSYMLDKVRFNQIFINILSNAVKFTPEGGHILFQETVLCNTPEKVEKVFLISDTGCGMSREFLPHAFDSFSQEYEGQRMHQEQGTGLGLSIVKQLVELMGGTITVESELGKGSTFKIHIYMIPQEDNSEIEQHTYPENSLKGLHILLCEDHPMNSKIAVRLLEKEGCTVEVAQNGKVGLEKYAASEPKQYDAILMDVRMPVMDGLEATRQIRALERKDAKIIPILAMTANAFVEDKNMCMDAGMNAHISKPIDPEEMYGSIYRAVNQRQDRNDSEQ